MAPTGTITAVAGSGGADTGAASLDNGDHYSVTNPNGVNGGGSTGTNEYTLLMDINTTNGGWNSLLFIAAGRSDGDLFIDSDGGSRSPVSAFSGLPTIGGIISGLAPGEEICLCASPHQRPYGM